MSASTANRPAAWCVAAAAAVAAMLTGCEPEYPPLTDPQAVTAARRVVILPLSDAPGPGGKGAGSVVGGVLLAELMRSGHYSLVNVSPDELAEACRKTGYSLADTNDPAVAAAIAREMKADAAFTGDLPQFATVQEHSIRTVMILGGGETKTDHLVGVVVRMVRASDGKIVYAGTGTGASPEGITPAASAACRQALAGLEEVHRHSR